MSSALPDQCIKLGAVAFDVVGGPAWLVDESAALRVGQQRPLRQMQLDANAVELVAQRARDEGEVVVGQVGHTAQAVAASKRVTA